MMAYVVVSILFACEMLNAVDGFGDSTALLQVRRNENENKGETSQGSLPFDKMDAVPTRTQVKSWDHYHQGNFRGAISKLCWYRGKPTWFDFAQRVVGFVACYGDECSEYVGGKDKEKEYCWSLGPGEVIKYATVWTAVGDEDRNAITRMKFCTEEERCSETFGAINPWSNEKQYKLECSKGHHFMAFHGYWSPPKATFDGDMRNIGMYCGYGGGSGQWELIGTSPHDASHYHIKYSICSTHTKTSTKQVTSEWSISVKTEMKFGLTAAAEEMPDVPPVMIATGDGAGETTVTIEGSYSNKVVDESSESFSQTECTQIDFRMKPDRDCYQWVVLSSFQGSGAGEVSTRTGAIECVPSGKYIPCCPPALYTDKYAQNCTNPKINLCKK
jgi:hypothetical protein